MSALESLDLTAWHFKLPSRSKELGSRLFEVRFHRFPGAQIFVYKRLQINSCSKCFWRWRDSRNSEGVGCRMRGRTKNSTRSHKRGPQPKSAKRGLVERGHLIRARVPTRRASSAANDKLMQTRPHVQKTITSLETAIRDAKRYIHYSTFLSGNHLANPIHNHSSWKYIAQSW